MMTNQSVIPKSNRLQKLSSNFNNYKTEKNIRWYVIRHINIIEGEEKHES